MVRRGIIYSVLLLALALVVVGANPSVADVNHTKFDKVSQCTGCHPRVKPTHWPQVPDDMQSLLPLGEDGYMTCTTCHICTRKTCELREPNKDLCMTCHDCTQGMACMIGTPHMGNSKDMTESALNSCLKCHESEGTPEICAVGNKTIHTSIMKTEAHSDYGRRVTFVNGEITCLSCHNPYNTGEFAKLIKSTRDTNLCTSCHDKRQYFDHSGLEKTSDCITCHPRARPAHTRQKPNFMKRALPLDDEGKMMCTTCHDCVDNTCDIRGNKVEICQVCHDCSGGMSCIIGTPHLGTEFDSKEALIDSCRDCHDGVSAPPVCRGIRGREIRERMEKTGETCTSCHTPYGKDKTPHEKLQSSKKRSIDGLQSREEAKFCPRRFVEIMDDVDCKKCHIR